MTDGYGTEYGVSYGERGPVTGQGQYDTLRYPGSAADGQIWVVDGTQLRVRSVSLSPTELSLEVRARSDSAEAKLSELDDFAGDLEETERADGTYRFDDTAGGANTYTVRPPYQLRPPRIEREWLVNSVTRDRASADTEAILATVSFVPSETRQPVTGYANSGVEWTFDLNGGTIITPRVSNIRQRETTTLQVILSARQAELFESVLAASAAAQSNPVPDGETVTRDTSGDGRQTATIEPPDDTTQSAIDADEYVVFGWTSNGSDGAAYRIDLEISTRFPD